MTDEELDEHGNPIEEDEDDYNTDLDVSQPLNIPERVPFSREDLINAHRLRNSDVIYKFIDTITNLPARAKTIRGLYLIVYDFYGQDTLLANLEGGKKNEASNTYTNDILAARLSLEKRLLYAKGALSKTEWTAEMISLHKAIYDHFKNFLIGRATGTQRERIVNATYTARQENISVQRDDTERMLRKDNRMSRPKKSYFGGK